MAVQAAVQRAAWRWRTEEPSGLSSEPGSVTWPPAVGNLPPRDDAPVKCRSAVPLLIDAAKATARVMLPTRDRACHPGRVRGYSPSIDQGHAGGAWRGGAGT